MCKQQLDSFFNFPPSKPNIEITLPPFFLTHFAALNKFSEFPEAENIKILSFFLNQLKIHFKKILF